MSPFACPNFQHAISRRHALKVGGLGLLGLNLPQILNAEAYGTNEIGRLFEGLAHMQASVAQTVKTVRDAADSIHTGADEIATGNADLSARTENQAASLEETAAAVVLA